MKIGELAERTGVSPRVLRHYELQVLVQSQRLSNGYRDYSVHTADIVLWIKSLIDSGFSTRQIRGFLPCLEGKHADLQQCAAGLARHKGDLCGSWW